MDWDPRQYSRFAAERDRPFADLLARVHATAPGRVLDIGCGTGALTASLARRWPGARVQGIDASPDMIAAAQEHPGVELSIGRAETVDIRGIDVVVSNATLQWVPGHAELLLRWAGRLGSGAWLAVQVPSNGDAASHVRIRELADSPRWSSRLAGVLRTETVKAPRDYVDMLASPGLRLDVWQTKYLHVLTGSNPVVEWGRGTALRPVLAALTPEEGAQFVGEYARLMRADYSEGPLGTVFPFRRTFIVVHRPAV